MLALDVSGSMGMDSLAGVGGITPRLGAAAMALIAARTESQCTSMAFATQFMEFPIGKRSSLAEVDKRMDGMPFGGTDCSLPMLYALQYKIPVDVFTVYTDNETWAGQMHPSQALRMYREKMGIRAKLIVVGMTATEFSIADQNDHGMMDVVGFDTAAPVVMADFARS
jgi:60 kDa SS-A/Ro ribonucleoprotein